MNERRSRPRQPTDCLACGLPKGLSAGSCFLCDEYLAQHDDDCLTCGAPPAAQMAHWQVGHRIAGQCDECGAVHAIPTRVVVDHGRVIDPDIGY